MTVEGLIAILNEFEGDLPVQGGEYGDGLGNVALVAEEREVYDDETGEVTEEVVWFVTIN